MELRQNVSTTLMTHRALTSAGVSVTGLTSFNISVVKNAVLTNTYAATTTMITSVVDGVYAFTPLASNINALGLLGFCYNTVGIVPFEMIYDVKLYPGDDAYIGIASIIVNVAAVKVDTASALVNIAGLVQASTVATVGLVASVVWNAVATNFNVVDSMGDLMHDAGAAGDPWATDLPGSYTGADAGAMLSTMSVNLTSTLVNIAAVKVDTASTVVAIASVRANMGYASTEAAIKVDTASTVVAVASLLVNVAAVKVDTASTVVAIASVRANMGYASTEAAIKVETASMLAKIDIIDTVADTIKVDTASTVVAITSVLANYAQASAVAAVKVDTASCVVAIASVRTNMGYASTEAAIKVDTASTVVAIASVLANYAQASLLLTQAQIKVQAVSALETMDIAQASEIVSVTGGDVWSAQASVYASVGSMGELLAAAGGAGDPWITELPGSYTGIQAGAMLSTMSINTASTVVAVASVLANYAQASSVAAIKVDTASAIVAIASVRANMGYASTEAAIKVDTASTLMYVTSAQVNIASVIVAIASVRANMGYASTETAIKVETASMLAKIDIIDTVADTIKVDTASTVVAIASVLTNYAQASAVAAVKVDTASTVVAIASVLANYAQASTVIGVAQASAIAAVVNAQVLDVLNVDTFAEPGQGAPAATTTLIQKLSYIFKFARNKLTATSTTVSIYADDAVTVDQKSIVSDDGNTFTRGEIGTGP